MTLTSRLLGVLWWVCIILLGSASLAFWIWFFLISASHPFAQILAIVPAILEYHSPTVLLVLLLCLVGTVVLMPSAPRSLQTSFRMWGQLEHISENSPEIANTMMISAEPAPTMSIGEVPPLPVVKLDKQIGKAWSLTVEHEPFVNLQMAIGGQKPVNWPIMPVTTTIGRKESNDIQLNDKSVTSEHAEIRFSDNGFYLVDLGSTNGTSVNNKLISQPHKLSDGDLIVIGGFALKFQFLKTYQRLLQFHQLWQGYRDAINDSNAAKFGNAASVLVDYVAHEVEPCKIVWNETIEGAYTCVFESDDMFVNPALTHHRLLALAGNQLSWYQIEALLQATDGQGSTFSTLCLVIMPEVSVDGDAWNAILVKARRRSIDLVFLSETDLEAVIVAVNSPEYLRRKIRTDIQPRHELSPYVNVGPIDIRMFYGRQKEVIEVKEKVATRSMAVVGARRIGKTSLLHHLHNNSLVHAGYRTVLHDCSVDTPESFRSARLHNCRPAVDLSVFRTIGDLIDDPPSDPPLVLLLDEVDGLLAIDEAENRGLFRGLRAKSNQNLLQVVMAGEKTLYNLMHDPKSPMFNFVSALPLGPLDIDSVHELVVDPLSKMLFDLEDETTIVQLIYHHTLGHPSIVQHFCTRLIDQVGRQHTRRITADDVREIFADSQYLIDDLVNTYLEGTSPLERLIMTIISSKSKPMSVGEIRHILESHEYNIHPSAVEIQQALTSLVYLRHILRISKGNYILEFQAFSEVYSDPSLKAEFIHASIESYSNAKR